MYDVYIICYPKLSSNWPILMQYLIWFHSWRHLHTCDTYISLEKAFIYIVISCRCFMCFEKPVYSALEICVSFLKTGFGAYKSKYKVPSIQMKCTFFNLLFSYQKDSSQSLEVLCSNPCLLESSLTFSSRLCPPPPPPLPINKLRFDSRLTQW